MSRSASKSFGFIRAVACGISFIVAVRAYAQNPETPTTGATAEAERVIVTGSNIPTAEEVGPNPVFSLNRDLINKSGQNTTVEQLLKTQPVMNASSVPVQNNGTGQAGPTGTASISLRGFDPGASLVLIDGRRAAPFPGAANSGFGFVDLLGVPVTAVQSIEILKDGASTTYGADAVAGVVNLKLWKDFRGVQATVQYGNTMDKDAGEFTADLLFGVGDQNTSISGDMFFFHHNSTFNKDRGNSNVPPFLSSNTTPYNFEVSTDVALAAGAVLGTPTTPPLTPGVIPFGAPVRVFTTPPNNANGLLPVTAYIYNVGTQVRGPFRPIVGFNFNAFSSSYPEQERWGGYTAVSHKICDDQLQVYGDFYYVDAKTHDELAPNATNNWETPGSPTVFVPPSAPFALDAGGVPITPPNTPTAAQVGMPSSAFNPFNPFQQILAGASRSRIFDFGNRKSDAENISELFTVGMKGDKLFDGNWGYDAGFRYSQVKQTFNFQSVNSVRFERILNGADPLFDPTSSQYIGQTTPYNPFGDQLHSPFASNAPLINFATLHTKDQFTSKLATLDLNIYTTELFKLPAGGVGFAFGGTFSRESYDINPDDQNRNGENIGVGRIAAIKAGRKKFGLYAEASVPIISPEMGIPGLHALEFTYAGRYEEFRNNNTNAAVPKIGMRWQPFDDQLTIRSTWGQGFLEPSLVQLYGPTRFLLAPTVFRGFAPAAIFGPPGSATNPAQDAAETETTVEQLPNQALSPEHDRTFSGGIVYTPKWIQNWIPNSSLTLTVDLWDVERTGVVMFLSPSSVIDGYNAGRYPGTVSPAEPTASIPSVLFDPLGNFAGVSSPYLNGGRENARGFDIGIQYQIETGVGTFTSLTRVSYLDQFVFQFPGSNARQVAGSANTDWFAGSFFGDVTTGDGWLKWKGASTLDWSWHNWDLNTTVHMLDGFWEQIDAVQFQGFYKRHWVHPTWFTDAQLSYSLIFTAPVESQPVAGYSKDAKEVVRGKDGKAVETGQTANYAMPCWQNVLNNSTITVGVNNIFGEDPPQAFGFGTGNSTGYPGSLYDNLGRFLYVRLVKKF